MEVKPLSVYLCRLVGDSFCLCVDHGHLFGSGISGVKTLMNKTAKKSTNKSENSCTNNLG